MTDRSAYREAVAQIAQKAHAKLPECSSRIDAAVTLVLLGEVMLLPDGAATVGSCADPTRSYAVNGQCSCKDFEHAPANMCKHRIAAGIAKRVQEILGQECSAPETMPAVEETYSPDTARIPAKFIKMIHGKPFIRYAGLLHLAREAGLVQIAARFVSVTETLAVAEATATFKDGSVWTESGDATPGNVHINVKPHFARVALTRAKARVLRDFLGLADMCAAEEVE